MCPVQDSAAHVGTATGDANSPAVQSTDDVPEYPRLEQLRVQLAPCATEEDAQSLVYWLLPVHRHSSAP